MTKHKHGDWYLPWPDYGEKHFIGQDGPQLEKLEGALKYVSNWTHAIDGGAHVGSYTAQLCRLFSRVTAFEPVLESVACFGANVSERMADFKCSPAVYVAALGDRISKCVMRVPQHKSGKLMSLSSYAQEKDKGIIPVMPLDLFQFSDIGFIKLDLEGSEAKAIKGARDTIKRNKPVMLIEWKETGTRNKLNSNIPVWTQDFTEAEAILADAGLKHVETILGDRIYAPDAGD